MIEPTSPMRSPVAETQEHQKLRKLSNELEVTFLSEMLKAAKIGQAREGLGGGGIGEEQFASFMVENHARALQKTGGLGLAEQLFNAMKGDRT